MVSKVDAEILETKGMSRMNFVRSWIVDKTLWRDLDAVVKTPNARELALLLIA